MAIVKTNELVEGLSGRLGKSLVFKNFRGMTIAAKRSAPTKKQSEKQRTNRSKFRDAAVWAKMVLRDPLKKEYYQKKAKKLNLPNAYTAAITDYMRTPQVKEWDKKSGVITFGVSKKGFEVRKVGVKLTNATGEVTETRSLEKDRINGWMIRLKESELQFDVYVNIWDDAENLTSVRIPHRY